MANINDIFNEAINDLNSTKGFHAGVQTNPEYNPKTKKGRAVPQFIPDVSSQAGETLADKFVNTYSARGYTLNDYLGDKWEDVAVNPVNTKEELIRERAERQSAFTQLANGLIQTAGDRILLGILRGFSDLADIPYALLTGDQDYTNPVSNLIEQGQNAIRDNFEVYRKDPSKGVDFGDLGWYVNGATDIASTISLMVPGVAASRGLQALGRLSKVGKLFDKAEDAISASKLYNSGRASKVLKSLTPSGTTRNAVTEGAKLMMDAGLMRVAENYQEARESYKDIENTTLNELQRMEKENPEQLNRLYETYPEFTNEDGSRKSYDEIAKTLAEKGATETFADDMWLIGLDALQLRNLGNLYKSFNRVATKGTETAEKELLQRFGASIAEPKGIAKYIPTINATKGYLAELSEGFEEGFQYVSQNDAAARAMKKLNPNVDVPTMSDYWQDSQMWNSAIWGAIGGMAFKAIGEKGVDYVNKLLNNNDLSEQRRVEEIQERYNILNTALSDIANLNKNIAPATDEQGNLIIDQDGQLVYEKITPRQAEAKKQQLIKNLAAKLTIKAANNGNYEAMKSMFANPAIKKYIEESNGFDAQSSENFVRDLTSTMDEAFDKYLTEVKNATNAGIRNAYVAQLVAEQNVQALNMVDENQKAIDDYNTQINDIENEIESKAVGTDKDTTSKFLGNVREKFLPTYAKSVINRLNQNRQDIEAKKDSGEIGRLQYNRLMKLYDDTIKSIIKGLNIVDAEGNAINTTEAFDNYIEENKLDISDFNNLKDNHNDLFNLYVDRANTIISNFDALESVYKTDADYKNAGREAQSAIDNKIKQTHANAKTKLEQIYNKYKSSEEVNAIHDSLISDAVNPNVNIPVKDIREAREAFKVMQNTSDKGVAEFEADEIASRIAKNKDAGVETSEGHVTPEAAAARTATMPGPVTETTTTKPVVENTATETAMPPATTVTPSTETSTVTPTTNASAEESSEPSYSSNEQEVQAKISDEAKILARQAIVASNPTNADEVISEDDLVNTLQQQLADKGYTSEQLSRNSEVIRKAASGSRRIYIRRTFNNKPFSSIDYFDDLRTSDSAERKQKIEEFLKEYSKDNKLFSVNGKPAISLEGLLLRMYRDLQSTGNPLTVDEAYAIYLDLIDYINKSKKYINIRETRIVHRKYDNSTKLDIQRLFEDSKKSEIETDNRIGLFNGIDDLSNGIQRTEQDINYFNGVLSKLSVGDKIYVKPKVSNGVPTGIELIVGRPGRGNSVTIGFNSYSVVEDGNGFYLPKRIFGPGVWVGVTNGEYVSNIDEIIQTILYGGFDTSKIDNRIISFAKKNGIDNINEISKHVNDFKAMMLAFDEVANGDEVKAYQMAKDNIIIKYLVKEHNITNLQNPNSDGNFYGDDGNKLVKNVLSKFYNILTYSDEFDLSNDKVVMDSVYESYKNFLKRQYNNYAFTKSLAERAIKLNSDKPGANNKILVVSVKSFNRGKPLTSDKLKPLKDTLAHNIKACKVVVVDEFDGCGENERHYIAEDGSYEQKFNSTEIGINVFNLMIPTGSKTPEFINLVAQKVSNTSPYGVAIRNYLFNELKAQINNNDYSNLKKKLFDLFNYDGVVEGVFCEERTSESGVTYIGLRRKSQPEGSKPDIVIYENTGTIVDSDNNAVSTDEKIQNLLNLIFNDNEVKYAFPGRIVFGKAGYENNTFIKKEGNKIHVNIGKYNKTFDSFAEFIYDSDIAYSYLDKTEYEYPTSRNASSKVESNYDFYYTQTSKRERPRITLNNDYSISEVENDREYYVNEQGQTSEDMANITAFVNELEQNIRNKNKKKKKNFITISDEINVTNLINIIASNYSDRINDYEYQLLREMLPDYVYYNNDKTREDTAYYDPNTDNIYLTRKYFDDRFARSKNSGQRQAMRILLHESIHKQIHDKNNTLNFKKFNAAMDEIKAAVNRALNDENSREYKEFNNIDWGLSNPVKMREHFKGLFSGIEQEYSTSANKENRINEEWLVEAITSESVQTLLNNITTEEQVKVEQPKTLLQKIFDLIRKLFNFGEIKDDTLLAKQFNAISDLFSQSEEAVEETNQEKTVDSSPVKDDTNIAEITEDIQQQTNNASEESTEDLELDEDDDVANEDDEQSSIAYSDDVLYAPSPNVLDKELSLSESASIRSQIERGTFQILCR